MNEKGPQSHPFGRAWTRPIGATSTGPLRGGNVLHVLPVGDTIPHVEYASTCFCRPRATRYGRVLIVVHNAADGRK